LDPASCGIYFPVTDVIGKAVLMLNASGRIVGTGEYDPFGHVNRVFIDAETAHPYDSATGIFADFTQALGAGFALDMRLRVDLLDLDAAGGGNGCAGGAPVDVLELRDGDSFAVLATMMGVHQGFLSSDWIRPASGHVQLAVTGTGHCVNSPGCADGGCQVVCIGIHCFEQCTGCPPGSCYPVCDNVTQKSATGVVAGSYEYRRYEAGQIPFWTPVRFPGQYYDPESDLFENWNRYLNPAIGRYSQTEPLSQQPSMVLGRSLRAKSLSSYAYAGSNPLSRRDPNGFQDENSFGHEFCGTFSECVLHAHHLRQDRCRCRKDGGHGHIVTDDEGRILGYSCSFDSGCGWESSEPTTADALAEAIREGGDACE